VLLVFGVPSPASHAGGAGARPDHPISSLSTLRLKISWCLFASGAAAADAASATPENARFGRVQFVKLDRADINRRGLEIQVRQIPINARHFDNREIRFRRSFTRPSAAFRQAAVKGRADAKSDQILAVADIDFVDGPPCLRAVFIFGGNLESLLRMAMGLR
jgi:hypothetical protein